MFCWWVVFAIFAVVHSSEGGPRNRRWAHYRGPPAPLNHDGTVALTPEVQRAREAHNAAFAAEFKRLEEAKRLASAHPHLFSPHEQGWKSGGDFSTGHFSPGPTYDKKHSSQGLTYSSQGPTLKYSPKTNMAAPLNLDGTVALTPEVQQAKAAHDAAQSEELKRLKEAEDKRLKHPVQLFTQEQGWEKNHGKFSSGHLIQGPHSDQGPSHSSAHSHNPEAHMSAPLNPDGTVAQTAAFKAIAASLDAEYDKALHRIKQNPVNPHFQTRAAQVYAY